MTPTSLPTANPVAKDQPQTELLPGAAEVKPNITRNITDSGVCILVFDRPDSAANIFDRATMTELAAHLDFIESSRYLAVAPPTGSNRDPPFEGCSLL